MNEACNLKGDEQMNKKSFFKWLLAGLVVALMATACTTPQEAQPEESKPTIRLAENSWLNAKLNTAVAKILLEDEMGYPVEVVPIDGDGQFPALDKGELHATLEVWVSGRSAEIQEYTEKGTVEIGGELGVVGRQGWFIPAYMLDEHPELATWEGLKDPEIAALFSTPETGDKGQLFLGDPTWPYIGPDVIKGLELPLQAVYAGSEEALLAALGEAYSKKEPILFYFWTPHTAFAQYELAEVKLPEYSEECAARAETGGRDCGYPPDVLLKLFSSNLSDYAPEAYYFLENFNYTNEDQIMMLGLVEVQGKTIEEAARLWIEQNENVWRAWIP